MALPMATMERHGLDSGDFIFAHDAADLRRAWMRIGVLSRPITTMQNWKRRCNRHRLCCYHRFVEAFASTDLDFGALVRKHADDCVQHIVVDFVSVAGGD